MTAKDNDIIFTESYEMLRAMYDFPNASGKKLSFSENDYFILHPACSKERNWWQVIDKNGQLGYIPSNYVMTESVDPQKLLDFIDDCTQNACKASNASEDGAEFVQRLNERKRNIEMSLQRRLKTGSISDGYTTGTSVPNLLQMDDFESSVSEKTSSTGLSTELLYELVETVRAKTKLSHEGARLAVQTVLEELHLVAGAPQVRDWLAGALSACLRPMAPLANLADQTRDGRRLKVILGELVQHKEDSQQRSWALHEDETVLRALLAELIDLLSDADPAVCRQSLDAGILIDLAEFYQMETRWQLRKLLLQAFGLVCGLDRSALALLVNSVLPLELARDMVDHPRETPRLCCSALLLTMLFSMGDPVPIAHFDHVGAKLLAFLLDALEDPPDTDVDDQIPDLFLHLVLALNLQQAPDPAENLVVRALAERGVAKTFTEKLLLLLNREEDPVRIFDHEPAPPHSVLKLCEDLFADRAAAGVFYTNDVKVLLDIVTRQLADLSAGDARRAHYLVLCRYVLRNTNFSDHRHRLDDLKKCFNRIFCEDSDLSCADHKLVRDISNEFPQYFK